MKVLGDLRQPSRRFPQHEAAARRGRAPAADVELELWDGLKAVPPYDEDDDNDPAPAAVARLRAAIAGADALLFATPEYNSSIPGQLKNALDWASRPVAANVLRNKPVAVVGASTGAFGAVWSQAELRKVLGRDRRARRRRRGRGRPRPRALRRRRPALPTRTCATSYARLSTFSSRTPGRALPRRHRTPSSRVYSRAHTANGQLEPERPLPDRSARWQHATAVPSGAVTSRAAEATSPSATASSRAPTRSRPASRRAREPTPRS